MYLELRFDLFFTVSLKVLGNVVVGSGQNKILLWEYDHWTKVRLRRDKVLWTFWTQNSLKILEFPTSFQHQNTVWSSQQKEFQHQKNRHRPRGQTKTMVWTIRYLRQGVLRWDEEREACVPVRWPSQYLCLQKIRGRCPWYCMEVPTNPTTASDCIRAFLYSSIAWALCLTLTSSAENSLDEISSWILARLLALGIRIMFLWLWL